jgi:ElaB/YqjD/DUF883 family membrane-anchored ribosome-binding protein
MVKREDHMKPEQIEADIHQRRAEMDETIHELSERLNPRRLIDSLFGMFRGGKRGGRPGEAVRDAGSNVAGFVREHSVPLTIIGAGVAWLIYEQAKGTQRSARAALPSQRGGTGEMLQRGREGLRHAGERVRQKAEHIGEHLRETAEHMGERVHHGYERSHDALSDTVRESPIAVGVGALAAGVLVGLLLPITRREQQSMGVAGGETWRQATHRAHEPGGDPYGGPSGLRPEDLMERRYESPIQPPETPDSDGSPAERVGKAVRQAGEEAAKEQPQGKVEP